MIMENELQKGESIQFLDYTIKNSLNNDGIVLFKRGTKAKGYETHLGNYGTDGNPDSAKRAAIFYFMIARPETFSSTIYYRMMGRGGQYHEFFKFKKAVEVEGIELPEEITPGNGMNAQIYFNNHKIQPV